MKKIITLSVLAFFTTTMYAADDSVQTEIDGLKAQLTAQDAKIAKLEKKQEHNIKKISHVNELANNDNLKFKADLRTAYDYISYKTANGKETSNGLFSNRLWLNMAYAPTNHLSFYSTLAYYKLYGQTIGANHGFNYNDAYVNETANPSDELRVKEAFWLYRNNTFLSMDIPWTASIGRRPSTDGLLVNYREDQRAKSAIGHDINIEFDGASFLYQLENVTNVPGMSLKFCLGRGMSDAYSRASNVVANGKDSNGNVIYSFNANQNYSKVAGFDNTDLYGVLFKPYDDGQYSLHTVWFKAFNLPGMVVDTPNADPTKTTYNFKQTGAIEGGAASFVADGIGDGISDMLDDSVVFASFAYSKTHPGATKMLGSKDAKTGTSIYVGANWPCQLIDNARVGIEYNHGSKYWRSLTYGEDTLAGSKLAVRGDAYEAFFNKELIGHKLTAQIRYTYMDYKYTGSNAFFGDGGTPMTMSQAIAHGKNPVDSAQDIRAYIRYRY